jgi:hypothetical protein
LQSWNEEVVYCNEDPQEIPPGDTQAAKAKLAAFVVYFIDSFGFDSFGILLAPSANGASGRSDKNSRE